MHGRHSSSSSPFLIVAAFLVPTGLAHVMVGCAADDALVIGGDSHLVGAADSAAAQDAGADAVLDAHADTVSVDIAVADVAPKCPGEPSCACSVASDCPKTACVPAKSGPICAGPCTPAATCGAGFVCKSVGVGATGQKLCVPLHPYVCDPCANSAACASVADPTARCAAVLGDGGASGWYCAPRCTGPQDCPLGYLCDTYAVVDGAKEKVCAPAAAACPCSAAAVVAGRSTPCSVSAKSPQGVAIGTCTGQRKCKAKGLGACDAATPQPEGCDGLDNDCDSITDAGSLCDDFSLCTTDACAGAKGCTHVGLGGNCDDKNPCTDDACDKIKGCVTLPNQITCDDAEACTATDVCKAGVCGGVKVICDDKNACTQDTCLPGKGCAFTPTAVPCNDGTACTVQDACANGACAGKKLSCDDANLCTDDACDPVKGCTLAENAVPCNDGSACTAGDLCADGACAGQAVACADGQVCTDDSCIKATGCVYLPNTSKCSDGDACTASDACKGGACLPGAATDCQDGNLCTADSCDNNTGTCSHAVTNEAGACVDGSVCTGNDTCQGGLCVGQPQLVCDDKNPCSDDSCDAKLGCVSLALDATACDDANPCTTGESCKKGTCSSGQPLEDGKPCGDGKACSGGACKAAAT